MPDVKVTRDFPVSAQRLFDVVTNRADLVQWWGHMDSNLQDHALDFSREGPWFSEVRHQDGTVYKMSGHVTHVRPPVSVGLTWGWHDNQDNRGDESHVTFTIEPLESGGARLIIDHRDLNAQDAESHARGWEAVLDSLNAYLT